MCSSVRASADLISPARPYPWQAVQRYRLMSSRVAFATEWEPWHVTHWGPPLPSAFPWALSRYSSFTRKWRRSQNSGISSGPGSCLPLPDDHLFLPHIDRVPGKGLRRRPPQNLSGRREPARVARTEQDSLFRPPGDDASEMGADRRKGDERSRRRLHQDGRISPEVEEVRTADRSRQPREHLPAAWPFLGGRSPDPGMEPPKRWRDAAAPSSRMIPPIVGRYAARLRDFPRDDSSPGGDPRSVRENLGSTYSPRGHSNRKGPPLHRNSRKSLVVFRTG